MVRPGPSARAVVACLVLRVRAGRARRRRGDSGAMHEHNSQGTTTGSRPPADNDGARLYQLPVRVNDISVAVQAAGDDLLAQPAHQLYSSRRANWLVQHAQSRLGGGFVHTRARRPEQAQPGPVGRAGEAGGQCLLTLYGYRPAGEDGARRGEREADRSAGQRSQGERLGPARTITPGAKGR